VVSSNNIETVPAAGNPSQVSGLTAGNLAAALNGASELEYGRWGYGTATDNPVLVRTAVASTSPAAGWVEETKTIYLDPTYTGGDSDGTESKPYTSLTTAVSAAEGGVVYIMSPVTISGRASYYDSVIFSRYKKDGSYAFTGAMFIIDAGSDNYVTMTSTTISGGYYTRTENGKLQFETGDGTLFQVKSGRLRLRGGITLQDAALGVDVDSGAQLEVNYASITATTAVKLSDSTSTFILDNFGTNDVSITGTIYLGSGSYITANAAIPCKLNVASAVSSNGTVVATGTSAYQLTGDDVEMLTVNDGDVDIALNNENQIVIEISE
jgi:hypothetical protein